MVEVIVVKALELTVALAVAVTTAESIMVVVVVVLLKLVIVENYQGGKSCGRSSFFLRSSIVIVEAIATAEQTVMVAVLWS